MVNPPVLAIPEVGDELILDTDASKYQLGCVLQLRSGEKSLRPVGYWSRMLNSAESNYSATDKEALAIVWAVKTLRPYVERKPFKFRTDHCALRWLYGAAADGNSRIERWRLTIANFDFEVLYRPGMKNQAADAMSRLLTSVAHSPEPIDEIPVLVVIVTEEEENDIETTPDDDAPHPVIPYRGPRVRVPDEGLIPISFDEIHEEQLDCPFVFQLWARMEMPQIRHLGLIEEDGLLHIRNMQGEDRRRLVAPISLRERILTLAQFPRVASHPGGRRLYRIVDWWWPALARDAALFVKRCVSFQASRAKRSATRTVPLCLLPPSGPMEFM
jgi:hypothetical protein